MSEQINWSRDFDSAVKEAQKSGKQLLLDFSAAPL